MGTSRLMNDIFRKTVFIGAVTALLSVQVLAQDAEIKDIDFGEPEPLSIESEVDTHDFMVEIADTPDELTRGMMYRDVVPPNTGMLFKYENPDVKSIWMKNTGVSLDIIFIRQNGKILKIEHNASPYSMRSISSEATAAAVLELGGGQALELGIMPGDLVRHEFFGTVEKPEETTEE